MEFDEFVRSSITEKYNLLQKKETYTEDDLKHVSQNIVDWKRQQAEFDKAVKAGTLDPMIVRNMSLDLMYQQQITMGVLDDMERYSKELRSKLNETITKIEKEESI